MEDVLVLYMMQSLNMRAYPVRISLLQKHRMTLLKTRFTSLFLGDGFVQLEMLSFFDGFHRHQSLGDEVII